MSTEEQLQAVREEEIRRIRAELPPGGHRVLLEEVARRAGILLRNGEPDIDRTLRRLTIISAAGEALVQRIEGSVWVWRRMSAPSTPSGEEAAS